MKQDKHYIAVDKEKVLRCTWCGSTESDKWIRGKNRGVYCSPTCERADSLDGGLCCLIMSSVIWMFVMIVSYLSYPELLQSSNILYTLILFGPFFSIFGLAPFIYGLRKIWIINEAKAAVPRNSRNLDDLFDERYLHCEKCGAPLEIKDGAIPVRCQFCGYVNRVSYSE